MRCKRVACGLVGFCLIVGTAIASAEELKWKLSKGEAFKISLKQEFEQLIPTPAGKLTNRLAIEAEAVWKVKDVTPEGHMVVEQRVRRMKMTITPPPPTPPIVVDTDAGEAPSNPIARQIASGLARIKDVVVTTTIAPDGTTVDSKVEGAEGVSLPGNDSNGVKDLLRETFLLLPKGSIAPGKTWTQRIERKLPQIATMEVTTKYTFEGTESAGGKSLAKIKMDSTFRQQKAAIEGGKGESEPKAEPAKKKIGSATGYAFFDIEEGRLASTQTDAKMTLPLTMVGQTIQMDQKFKLSMKVEPLKSGAGTAGSSEGSP